MYKETAIDWLVENLYYILKTEHYDIIEKAKEMEKEQMLQADSNGYNRNQYNHDLEYGGSEYWEEIPQEFEQYYNKTHKQEYQ
jgi:hypothetical protein